MRHFRVKNFERFQHYKDRSPPWIKLYNELLDDYDFACLPDASKAHLIAIWLLASRSDNRIPYDARWVQNRISATEAVDLDTLARAGFIVPDQECSTMLAERKPEAIPEREEEGESEGEKKQTGGVATAPPATKLSHVKRDGKASRLPSNFVVPDGWKQSAAEARERHGLPSINLDLEAEKFVDYWTSKAGQGATKTDWRKTFVNWCRNANAPRPNGQDPPPTKTGLSPTLERMLGNDDELDRQEDGAAGRAELGYRSA